MSSIVIDNPEFWVVWCEDQRPPMHKHHSYKSAVTEAARLARENPCKHFHVLSHAATAIKVDVQMTEVIGSMPF